MRGLALMREGREPFLFCCAALLAGCVPRSNFVVEAIEKELALGGTNDFGKLAAPEASVLALQKANVRLLVYQSVESEQICPLVNADQVKNALARSRRTWKHWEAKLRLNWSRLWESTNLFYMEATCRGMPATALVVKGSKRVLTVYPSLGVVAVEEYWGRRGRVEELKIEWDDNPGVLFGTCAFYKCEAPVATVEEAGRAFGRFMGKYGEERSDWSSVLESDNFFYVEALRPSVILVPKGCRTVKAIPEP